MKVVTMSTMLENYRAEELDCLELLWQRNQNGERITALARERGQSRQELMEDLRQAGYLSHQAEPSPAEIARVASLLRSQWSQQMQRNRWVGNRKIPDVALS